VQNRIITEAHKEVVCVEIMIKIMWIIFVHEEGLVDKEAVHETKTLSSKLQPHMLERLLKWISKVKLHVERKAVVTFAWRCPYSCHNREVLPGESCYDGDQTSTLTSYLLTVSIP
jgi:imidazolonepropionase-like amidohydrolase